MELPKSLFDALTAGATVALAVAAWIQLPLISEQVKALAEQIRLSREAEANTEKRARESATLEACQRYDYDPIIDVATQNIWRDSKQGTSYTKENVNPRDAIVILNYLDGLSIGIAQGLYLEDIVKDHLGPIFKHSYVHYIQTGITDEAGLEAIANLYRKWYQVPQAPAYDTKGQITGIG